MKKRLIKKKQKATWQQKYQMELSRNHELVMKESKHAEAIEQTRMLVDGLLIRAAVEYGKEENGTYRIELPDVPIEDTISQYSLGTLKEGEKLVLLAVKK